MALKRRARRADGSHGPSAPTARLVLLLPLIAAAFLTVPLAGGRLAALAELRFKGVSVVLAALLAQVLIISVAPEGTPVLHRAVHLATYLAGGYVIVRNRSIPGLWLIGLGGAANFAAIALNGG